MTEDEFHALLQRYLDGRCTPDERARVEHWYNHLEEAEGAALLSQNQEAVEDAIWQRLHQHTRAAAVYETRVLVHPASFWQKPQMKAAAALVLLVLSMGLLLLFTRSSQTRQSQPTIAMADGWTRHRNTTRQVQQFRLPDESRITLHPGSSLRYPTAFAGSKRKVYLQGEAFFQVSKNPARPFLVFTRQVVTTVLGTSFRVKAYAESKVASVAVSEGKVAVQARKPATSDTAPLAAPSILLLPNQQVVYSAVSRRLKKELVDKPVVLAPQSFEFEERPVTEVLQALEKAYGVDIEYDKATLAGCTVSITFYDEPLFEKLGLLCKSLDAYYSLSDAQIIMHSKGCQSPLGG